MAFRIEHGKVSTVGKAAQAAGASERQHQKSMIAAQQKAQAERQEAEMQFKAKLMAHQEELDLTAAMRSQEFELEKMELRSQQQTQLELMRQQAFFEKDLAKELKQVEEMDNKVAAIDKAVKSGVISQGDANMAKLRLQIGIPVSSGKPVDPMSAILQKMMGGAGGAGMLTEEESGAGAVGEPYVEGKADRTMEEAISVFANPYYAAQQGYFKKKTVMKANIPAMRTQLTTAMESPDIDDETKLQIIDILQTGTDKTIEKAWKRIYGEQ